MGILGRLGRQKALSARARQEALVEAINLFRGGADEERVAAVVSQRGASPQEAAEIVKNARQRVDKEVLATVSLPPSSRGENNYYFLLGVVPDATEDDIRRAYRRKAKLVHPDRHHQDFTVDQWGRLMTTLTDAERVLTDPRSRRAYDLLWRERSRAATREHRRKGERRGDWETRYRWQLAELARMELGMTQVLDELKLVLESGDLVSESTTTRLAEPIEHYETVMLDVRTQTHALPSALKEFGDRVRIEMQRKERVVTSMRRLLSLLPDAGAPEDIARALAFISQVRAVIDEVQAAQHQFELGTARPFI